MGLFDGKDTWARIEKYLRGADGDTFLLAPKLNPRWARFVFTLTMGFFRAEGGACYPLSLGRQPPLPCLWARSEGELRGETIYFPTESGGQPRGRHSDDRAAPWQTAT